MVGDRIDNDVRPARMAGMKTIWLDLDLRDMDYQPEDEYERLYMESYHRVTGIDRDISAPASQPDAMVQDVRELPRAVAGVISQLEVAG
jgi:FMN phosphatase YigB (HAD superfamily)